VLNSGLETPQENDADGLPTIAARRFVSRDTRRLVFFITKHKS
jgi:hypothetical protein